MEALIMTLAGTGVVALVLNIWLSTKSGKKWLKSLYGKNEVSVVTCYLVFSFLIYYFFNHLSNQPKKVRCQSTPFCGFNTQWFSSG